MITNPGNGNQNRSDDNRQRLSIDWGFFNSIPVQDVLDLLGTETNGRGKFCCPAHNDKNPSAQIQSKYNGWHCWSCHAGKTVLDLVKYTLNCEIRDAALYLNQYFPGGIKEYVDDGRLTPPLMNDDFKKLIGLRTNPYNAYSVDIPRGGYAYEYGKDEIEFVTVKNEFEEEDRIVITEMVLDKINDAIENYEKWLSWSKDRVVVEAAKALGEKIGTKENIEAFIEDMDGFYDVTIEHSNEKLAILYEKREEFTNYKNRLEIEAASPQAVASQDEIKAFFERIAAERNKSKELDKGDDGDIER